MQEPKPNLAEEKAEVEAVAEEGKEKAKGKAQQKAMNQRQKLALNPAVSGDG